MDNKITKLKEMFFNRLLSVADLSRFRNLGLPSKNLKIAGLCLTTEENCL